MRHGASLLASLEGMSRPAFRIAKELAANSRSGLTVRFLSKKLEIAQEEVEYLIDVNHRIIFSDLTKVKIVPEGYNAIKRVSEGLENYGDIPSLHRNIKGLSPHEFRRIEERLGLEQPVTKKAAIEALVERYYPHPESILTYVATRGFSDTARELFDILWQSKDGLMPVSQLRIAHGGSEFEVEQALWELLRGFACFELFRFDSEDRLVRMAALLSEIRQYRKDTAGSKGAKSRPKPLRNKPDFIDSRGLDFSDNLCKLVAAVAARPVRLRGDGDMFREDHKRLSEIFPEDSDPSLNTCLWVAEGVGWLTRVDNTLRAGALESLIEMDRVQRHRILYEWLTAKGDDASAKHLLTSQLDDIRPGSWYPTVSFVRYAIQAENEHDQAVLRPAGAHWQYLSPAAAGQNENHLLRSLEGSFFWLGLVDQGESDGESAFSLTELGEVLLLSGNIAKLLEMWPPRKGEFIVQPNFDIVVPTQDVDPLLTVPLDQFAQRGSTGQATVYNVTKESFVQAVQEGHDPGEFVEFLLAHNRGGTLPANVMTTLEDWRGGMRRVRLRTMHILETDDPLVLADLLHRRRYSRQFKPLDPKKSVGFTGISKNELAKALEKDGFIVE